MLSPYATCLLFLFPSLALGDQLLRGADQHWGYIDVRDGAHMFYWLYHTTANVSSYTERPLVLWLQGGPGGCATALGNMVQLGPMDIYGQPRNSTWLQHVNLLFVDSPVGAGYSYVDDEVLLPRINSEIADDLVMFFIKFYKKHQELQKLPLHIFTESYGGKMGAEFALKFNAALPNVLQSLSVGNPWISPAYYFSEHANFLFINGFVDEIGALEVNNICIKILHALNAQEYGPAMELFLDWYKIVQNTTGYLYTYNTQTHVDRREDRTYGYGTELTNFMIQNVSEVLGINGSIFQVQTEALIEALLDEHMRSGELLVTRLLNETSIKVNIFSGQLDVMCPTVSTVNLIKDMNWKQKAAYLAAPRVPIVVDHKLQGYQKIGGNFGMFWINRAGHMVAIDNPVAMNYVLKTVTNYDAVPKRNLKNINFDQCATMTSHF